MMFCRSWRAGSGKEKIMSAKQIAEEGILMIVNGNVRKHKLNSIARIHTGQAEKKEYQNYRNFLPGKNGCMVHELTGSNNY